MQTQNTRNNTN